MPDAGSEQSSITHDRAGLAGMIAAMTMLAVQLTWRLNWSSDPPVPAFPEFVVAAISRLTPMSVFGAATENYGSLAKKTLFVTVLIGIIAVGRLVGFAAGKLANSWGPSFLKRLAAGLVVAALLLLVTLVVIMPLANLGFFATKSSYTEQIIIQLVATFSLFALVWSVITSQEISMEPKLTDTHLDRREMLSKTVLGGAAGLSALALGTSTWKLLNPDTGTTAAEEDVARQKSVDIVATQRAKQGYDVPTPTVAPTEPADSAALTADFALQSDDPLALFLDLEGAGFLSPVLTATPDFYHVSKNIVDPQVSADGWSLKISGLVDKELNLSLADLQSRANTDKITTLCCISNELNGDLISTALWTGVPLADLLNEAGVQAGAVDLRFHAADDYQDSVPIDRGLDPDNLVVISMNGEPLPDYHGFPARLIIPNIYGMKNVKWIDKIEVIDYDYFGYWESQGWSDDATCQIWGRIDHPADDLKAGEQTICGMAAAGDRDVSRVEVSLDDGGSWADAILEPPLNSPFTWVRWAFPFDAKPGDYTIRLRVTDGAGAVAIEKNSSPLPDGATGWPKRKFSVKS